MVRLGRALAGALLLAAGLLALLTASRSAALGPDAGALVMTSRRVLEGSVPYVDFRTLYPAGVYYLQAALIWIGGGSADALRLQMVVEHLLVALSLGGVLSLRLAWSPLGAAGWAGLFLLGLPALEGSQYSLEPMASAAGWAAIAVATWLGRRGRAGAASRIDLAGGFVLGCLVGGALFVKQPAALFLGAIPLHHLDAGRLDRRALVAELGGLLALPALFFAVHPAALSAFWDQNVALLWSYGEGSFVPRAGGLAIATSMERHALIPILLLVALIGAVGRWRTQPGDALMLFAGTLLALPSLVREYGHYFLFPWPFAVFGAALLVRRYHVTRLPAVGALACAAYLLVPFLRFYGTGELGRLGARETAIADVMARSLGGRAVALILPSSPQFYILTGTRSPDDDYSFVDNARSFDEARQRLLRARAARAPAFLVDRGGAGSAFLSKCDERLRQLGYRLVGDFPDLAVRYYEAPRP